MAIISVFENTALLSGIVKIYLKLSKDTHLEEKIPFAGIYF